MGMKKSERLIRDQTVFYLRQSAAKLSKNAALVITKAPQLQSFLHFLVEHDPKRMSRLLKAASEEASAALTEIDAQKECECDTTINKRAAPSCIESPKTSKRTKLASVSGTTTNSASCVRDSQKTLDFHFAPLCSPQPNAENPSSETEIDDGVELATQDPEHTAARENTYANELTDDEHDQEEDYDGEHDQEEDSNTENDGRIDDEVQPADEQMKTPEVERLQALNQPADAQNNVTLKQEPQDNSLSDINNETRPAETYSQNQSLNDTNFSIRPAETYYEIERGLTNGDPSTISKLRNNSPILSRPETDTIFDLCQKLDFVPVQFKLVKYLEDRRAEIGTEKKTDPIPSTRDLAHPDEIYDVLCVGQAHTDTAKIRRAYDQMNLFDKVNQLARTDVAAREHVKEDKLYIWHLENLATRKAGNVSADKKKIITENYKNQYHAGGKWTEVSTWFGGKGIVMVFVLAEIGSFLIARGLKAEQRLALEELSQYLGSIKKMVTTLGPDALEDFCRYGYLSEAKINELEELEGGVLEDSEGEESEMEGVEGGAAEDIDSDGDETDGDDE